MVDSLKPTKSPVLPNKIGEGIIHKRDRGKWSSLYRGNFSLSLSHDKNNFFYGSFIEIILLYPISAIKKVYKL